MLVRCVERSDDFRVLGAAVLGICFTLLNLYFERFDFMLMGCFEGVNLFGMFKFVLSDTCFILFMLFFERSDLLLFILILFLEGSG
jgi:hypothetical protein